MKEKLQGCLLMILLISPWIFEALWELWLKHLW